MALYERGLHTHPISNICSEILTARDSKSIRSLARIYCEANMLSFYDRSSTREDGLSDYDRGLFAGMATFIEEIFGDWKRELEEFEESERKRTLE